MFASTVTIGSTSAGKSTFLIRFPPEMRTLLDSISDDENHVQGRMPQNMNKAYGSISGRVRAGQHHGEDERVDQEQQQRVDERPEEPEHRPAIAGLQLADDEALDEAAVLEEVGEVVEHGEGGAAVTLSSSGRAPRRASA